ncbi:MAG: hypothetical protein PHP69_03855 [Candidatus Omnitrophica bacterium]|nr:hypothetical protein [Candidatus Omnitrophota bacterium]
MSEYKYRRTSGQKWIKPEITRVKLNPEQAILSCCDSGLRGATSVSGGIQCRPPCGVTAIPSATNS